MAGLTNQLIAAGIPVDGVSMNGTITVQYNVAATQAQRTQGDAMAAAWSTAPVYRRKFTDVLSDIATLAANDPTNYTKVIRWVVARVLQLDPALIKTLNATLGLSIATTTTDPTHAE